MEQPATEWLNYQALIRNIWNKLQRIRKFVIIVEKEHIFMRKGFTLSELLLSLVIIGVVATLTVPVLLNNVHNKTFVSQIKNMSATIEQLAQDQLIMHHTRDLSDTDFGDPETLVSDKNFLIVKLCSDENDAVTNCWKTKSGISNRVKYKNIKGSTYDNTLPSLNTARVGKSAILKNGATIKYMLASTTGASEITSNEVGYFVIDINGPKKPNILGRDLFGFFVTQKGKIVGGGAEVPSHATNAGYLRTHCTGEDNNNGIKVREAWCYEKLVADSWEMDY